MEEVAKQSGVYRSNEIALRAILRFYGYEIETTDQSGSEKTAFTVKQIAEPDRLSDKLIQAVWRNNLQRDPWSYFDSIEIVRFELIP